MQLWMQLVVVRFIERLYNRYMHASIELKKNSLFFYEHILEQDNPGSLTVFTLRDNIIG